MACRWRQELQKQALAAPGLQAGAWSIFGAQVWAAAGPAEESFSRNMEPARVLDALNGGQLRLDVHGTPGAGEPSARSGHEGGLGSPLGCPAAAAARAGDARCGRTWDTVPCERASPGQPRLDAALGAHEAAGEAAERNGVAARSAAAPVAASAEGRQEAAVPDGQEAAAGEGPGAVGEEQEGAVAGAAPGGACCPAGKAEPAPAPAVSGRQVIPAAGPGREAAHGASEDVEASEGRSSGAAVRLPAEVATAAPAAQANGRQRRASAVAASRKVSSFCAHDAMEAWVRPGRCEQAVREQKSVPCLPTELFRAFSM